MNGGLDLAQKQREEARWRILRVIDAGRPIAVSESIVLRVLADVRLPLGPAGVRRELDYLRISDWSKSRKRKARPGSRG